MSAKQPSTLLKGTSGLTAMETLAPSSRSLLRVALRICAGIRMHGNPIGAGLDKLRRVLVRIGDHQVNVHRNNRDLTHPFDNDRANGDVRHEVAVHDIDVQPIGAGRFDSLDFVFETAEIRGQNRRSDFHRLHLRNLSHARGKKTIGIIPVRQRLIIFSPHNVRRAVGKIARGIFQLKLFVFIQEASRPCDRFHLC